MRFVDLMLRVETRTTGISTNFLNVGLIFKRPGAIVYKTFAGLPMSNLNIIFALIVLFVSGTALSHDNGHDGHDHEGTVYESPTETITINRTAGNLGMLALAAAGNQLDWGVPNKLQLSVAGAFVSGGNQAISFALGTRLGGVLLNVQVAATIDAFPGEDDSVIIVGATAHF